ncbi:MAG TPA: SAM-dependent methyltransferase, partial [Bacteroidetes bacterium]|nr:SAM-dependent methyltransferase [Bacteroidota bacterium]
MVEEADGKWRGSSVSEKDGQHWDKSKEMNFTYTNLDKFVRYSLGENAHFSNAFYDGDYSLTLDQA